MRAGRTQENRKEGERHERGVSGSERKEVGRVEEGVTRSAKQRAGLRERAQAKKTDIDENVGNGESQQSDRRKKRVNVGRSIVVSGHKRAEDKSRGVTEGEGRGKERGAKGGGELVLRKTPNSGSSV